MKKPRPQSVMVGRTVSSSSDNYPPPMVPTELLTTSNIIRVEVAVAAKTQTPSTAKASRRSMSFNWKDFSVFGGAAGDKKPKNTNLRPLTLKAGGNSVLGARMLYTVEDDDERRERERLNTTMRLMGIEKPVDDPAPIIDRSLPPNYPCKPSSLRHSISACFCCHTTRCSVAACRIPAVQRAVEIPVQHCGPIDDTKLLERDAGCC